MSWKKYFTGANQAGQMSPISGDASGASPAKRNYSSYLPEVYTGHPNRIQRYFQYDQMDADSEVNAALDIIAEFCTQKNKENNTAFDLQFQDQPTETETKILKKYLMSWCKENQFDQRVFKIFRNAIKYGDAFFIRDPETMKWLYVHPHKVSKIIVNESEGKIPEQYVVNDINVNLKGLAVTQKTVNMAYSPYSASNYVQGYAGSYNSAMGTGGQGGRFDRTVMQYAVNAEHIVHISMSEGLDFSYPFGMSILEAVFKVFKQKELLEDAVIIYRVQRAPERRVFYIDVGSMPTHLAMGFVERVKNEIHQRRIPSTTGGSQNVMDATFNPLSINEDYFFPQTAEGRGSKVETLPGGTNLGEIDDLKFFTNKLYRGLRIPSSYLPTGPEDSQAQYSDGRVGTAYIQELRFNKYCQRLQELIIPMFNDEFKLYLKKRGINIDFSSFNLKFNPPQNFAEYRRTEMDTQKVQVFTQVADIPYMSKRFVLQRYLGLSEEEVAQNQEMWRQENDVQGGAPSAAKQMRDAGISPGTIASDVAGQTPEPDLTPETPGGTVGPAGAGTPGGGGTTPGAGGTGQPT